MWKVVLVALVVGCGRSECEQPEFLCHEFARACGNNRIDSCELPSKEGCFFPQGVTEACDGTQVKSCGALGYYDGTSRCVSCEQVDTTACRACSSSAAACASYPNQQFHAQKLVVSGTHVLAVAESSRLLVFDGTTLLHDIEDAPVVDVVGVPGGFLLAGSQQLIPLAFDGSFGAPQSLPVSSGGPTLASNNAGRVLVVWQDASNIVSAIADSSGVLVTSVSTVFAGAGVLSVTSDGTQFFLGNAGRLARIADDNSLLGVTTGFPLAGDLRMDVIWDGIAGWYVTGGQIQRFTASGDVAGAPLGSPIADVTAGANKLLVLAFDSPELVVRGFSSLTSEITHTPLGTGAVEGKIVQLGDQVLGMWDVVEARAALLPSP